MTPPASGPVPKIHGLHDFRMRDVSYALVTLAPGQNLNRPAGVAGYFYHVLAGAVVMESAADTVHAGHRDTLVAGGYLAHRLSNPGAISARLLVGSEPFEYLAWLGTAPVITCHRAGSRHPLLARLFLAMDLVIEEISDPEIPPDQLTLERTAELIIFYFFRMNNPVTGRLDPFPWSDPRLMRAITAMTETPGRAWTVADLANHANMSRSAFAQRFRTVLGETPMRLLASIRLKAAARQMLEGEPLNSTALACGYGSEEAFNRAFKREFRITPGRWLRERARL